MKIILTILALFIIGCKKKEKYTEVRKTLEKVLIEDQKFRNPYIPEKQMQLTEIILKLLQKSLTVWVGLEKTI